MVGQQSMFGAHLRRLRERAGITQKELAELAGLSRVAIGALEGGRIRYPHPHTLRALTAALRLTEAEAASLRGAAARRRNPAPPPPDEEWLASLPGSISPLVGRHSERAELQRMLTTGEVRLVTLTGPGGVGKTHLALELAHDLAPVRSGGAVFVPLGAILDRTLLLPTIAEAIGVRAANARLLGEQVKARLRDRNPLLVLDNLEHLVWASPVAELLAACPALTVLATSRAPLRVSGEQEYPLRPLPVPPSAGSPGLADVANNEAATLFVQRARAADPGFQLTEANAPAVAHICVRLDGLPLAIELAAAQIKVLPPEALLARLEPSMEVLSGGRHDHAPRLRGIRATIAWSYELLASEEQALFRRLAVFAGGFTMTAAERLMRDIAPGLPPASTVSGLTDLVDQSLLRRLPGSSSAPRFGMLSTIREYALEQLEAAGEATEAKEGHARGMLDLAEQAWLALRDRAAQGAWLDRLEAERANLRAALRWLGDRRADRELLQLAGALSWFWYIRGPVSEGRLWLEQAFAARRGAVPEPVLARALAGAGLLAHVQGDDAQASRWLEASLTGSREPGDPWLRGYTLLLRGIVAEDRGDYAGAEPWIDKALAQFAALGDQANMALALTHRGVVAWGRGNVGKANCLWEEALAAHRAANDSWGISVALSYLGLLAVQRGDLADAAVAFRESVHRRREGQVWEDVAGSIADVAVLAAAVEHPELAARLFGAAAALREAMGRSGEAKLPEREVFNRAEAHIRRRLGADCAVAAFAAGRAWPRQHVLVEALALLDSIAEAGQGPAVN
jgi:predicted ATPase/transcriptional regulator with XRE-family HTH domain